MTSARRRWAAGALLVTLGWLASPHAVPVYDGIGQPDEPYRYVSAPAGAATTAAPTSGAGQTPLSAGRSTNGLSVQTAEQGPQFSLFLPPGALAAAGSAVRVTVDPKAPTDQPRPATVDGNVYVVTLADPAGPVTLTDKAAIATLYLRSTTQRTPGPDVYHRDPGAASWKKLQTSRGGFDVYVASFVGPGEYALAFAPKAAKSGGSSVLLPVLLLGAFVLLVVVVVTVRLRSAGGADGAADDGADSPE